MPRFVAATEGTGFGVTTMWNSRMVCNSPMFGARRAGGRGWRTEGGWGGRGDRMAKAAMRKLRIVYGIPAFEGE